MRARTIATVGLGIIAVYTFTITVIGVAAVIHNAVGR